jgi:hypothetical protein
LVAACGWLKLRKSRKVMAMDITITRTEINALPGSLRTHLDLPADAASHLLKLAPGQTLLLQVMQGVLWLTQDGFPDDIILQRGAQLQLREPGLYRLGAFGPVDAAVNSWAAP